MKVIRHRNRSCRVPILVRAAERFDRLKGCRIIEHRPAVFDTQGNKVSDDLVMSDPDGYARRARHAFDCRAAILAAKKKKTAAKITSLQLTWSRGLVAHASQLGRWQPTGIYMLDHLPKLAAATS